MSKKVYVICENERPLMDGPQLLVFDNEESALHIARDESAEGRCDSYDICEAMFKLEPLRKGAPHWGTCRTCADRQTCEGAYVERGCSQHRPIDHVVTQPRAGKGE